MTTTDCTTYDPNTYGARDYAVDTTRNTTATTAKQTKRALRVWLENKGHLEASGFSAGARYSATYAKGSIVLRLTPEGKGIVSSCKRNGQVRPIIDLHSAKVAEAFAAGQSVLATFGTGIITIKQA